MTRALPEGFAAGATASKGRDVSGLTLTERDDTFRFGIDRNGHEWYAIGIDVPHGDDVSSALWYHAPRLCPECNRVPRSDVRPLGVLESESKRCAH